MLSKFLRNISSNRHLFVYPLRISKELSGEDKRSMKANVKHTSALVIHPDSPSLLPLISLCHIMARSSSGPDTH